MIAPAVAARTGLPETTRVLSGLHDSNAGLLRPLAQQALPFTVVSTGTWVVIMAPGGSLDRLDPALDMLGNVDALGRPVPCIKFMGGREYGVLAGADTAPATPADLAAVIAAGIMALPGFAGQSGPFAGRVGRVVPDGAAPSPALAVLYIALMTDWCLERLGAAGPVIVEGSFVRTPLYAPLLAALGPSRRVLVSADTTGTVGGAVLLAGWPDAWPEGAPSAVTALDLPGLGPYRERWRAACADLPAGGIPR
jgi:sugar (pentulose or hexulose) kinase